MENEVVVGGNTYLISRLSLFRSLEMTRHVAPLLPAVFSEFLGDFLQAVRKEADATAALSAIAAVSEPVLMRIAEMPEEQFERVIKIALSACERKNDRGWAKVCINDNVMFDDIGSADALVLVWHVLTREVKPFIDALSKLA